MRGRQPDPDTTGAADEIAATRVRAALTAALGEPGDTTILEADSIRDAAAVLVALQRSGVAITAVA